MEHYVDALVDDLLQLLVLARLTQRPQLFLHGRPMATATSTRRRLIQNGNRKMMIETISTCETSNSRFLIYRK